MPRPNADNNAQDLLDASLALARTQLLGPLADRFYYTYIGQPSTPAREQQLAELGEAFANNARRLEAKRGALHTALVILALGLPASALAIGLV